MQTLTDQYLTRHHPRKPRLWFFRSTKILRSLALPFLIAALSLTILVPARGEENIVPNKVQKDWSSLTPVDTAPVSDSTIAIKTTTNFLSEPNVMRRDPSDVICSGDKYYVWYTKIDSDKPGYPGGWCGSVWYATSTDGYEWKEEGFALGAGSEHDWDGAGVYTPNILPYGNKYYLAYTAMPAPFIRKRSQAAIGIAVSESPDGPWKKLRNNPVIAPGDSLDASDGFLVDDTVFVLNNNKIWLYHKGFPKIVDEKGRALRAPGRNTFLLAATADKPEGPYTKEPTILHRGHEAVVWKDRDGIGSLGIGWGPSRFYFSRDGIHFKALNALNPPKAAGIYRTDFDKGSEGARPTWGISMGKNQGLARFEFIWPQEENVEQNKD